MEAERYILAGVGVCVSLFGFRTFADLKNRFQLKWKKLALGRICMALSIKSSTCSPSTFRAFG